MDYDHTRLTELGRETAKTNGGRFIEWYLRVAPDGQTQFMVRYKPRHWKNCPACAWPNDTAFIHVDPKGRKLDSHDKSVVVNLAETK